MPDTDSRGTDPSATRNGFSWVNHLQRSVSCELDYRMTMCSQEERMAENKPTSCVMYCFGIHLERPRKVALNQYILIPTITSVIVTWRLYLLSCFRSSTNLSSFLIFSLFFFLSLLLSLLFLWIPFFQPLDRKVPKLASHHWPTVNYVQEFLSKSTHTLIQRGM